MVIGDIAANDIALAPIFKKDTGPDAGQYGVHFGSAYDSHLLIPLIPDTGVRAS